MITHRPVYKIPVYRIFRDYDAIDEGVNQHAQSYLLHSLETLQELDQKAEAFYSQPGVYYFSLVDVMCETGSCLVYDQEPMYFDTEHLNWTGVNFISPALVDFIEKAIRNN